VTAQDYKEALDSAAAASSNPSLFLKVAEILYRHDPMGINLEINIDEYTPEVGTILPRLGLAHSVEDARRVVREEFHHWFGQAQASKPAIEAAADEIWEAWQHAAAEAPNA
jgi:hypothetical protein